MRGKSPQEKRGVMSLERFTVISTSDFNLYNRWFSGEDVTPVLEQRQALGFNSVRVWTAYRIPLIGDCDPHRPGFYARWPEFMDLIAQYGLYAEVTAFTGPYVYFPDQVSMIQHWNNLDDALTGCTNLLDLEAINEWDNGPNAGVPLDLLRRPVGKIASHGSGAQDSPPAMPHWDVAGYRSPSSEWQRKVGHNAMEWADNWGIPVWTNEYPRTDNDPNPDHWFDGAASSVLLCAGAGTFHSPSGKDSTLFQGPEVVCARAFVSGALSVPLEYQDGVYKRIDPPYPDGIIRIYRRILDDGRFHEVMVRE
jgi:hypothetical protein